MLYVASYLPSLHHQEISLLGDKRTLTKLLSLYQDIAAAVDEEDVVKFTDVVKEFDSMTPLVQL